MQAAPTLDWLLDMTPVDFVSDAIVYLALHQQFLPTLAAQGVGDPKSLISPTVAAAAKAARKPLCPVYHLANPGPIPMKKLFDWLQTFGFPVSQIPYSQWRQSLLDKAGNGQDSDNPLSPLLPLMMEKEEDMGTSATMPQFDMTLTTAALAPGGIKCPAISDSLLHCYFSYFVNIGFLSNPNQQDEHETEQFDMALDEHDADDSKNSN